MYGNKASLQRQYFPWVFDDVLNVDYTFDSQTKTNQEDIEIEDKVCE